MSKHEAQPKTNALRLAQASGQPVPTHCYDVDEEHLDAATVAQKIGMDPDRVFKTLLAWDGAAQYFVFILPGSCDLDLKKAARASGCKKVELAPLSRLTDLTGYIRGGCSPLGMKKPFPTFLDETAQLFDTIAVSAGVRGMQMELKPSLLLELCAKSGCPQAVFADLT